ncbi:hypothetical protein SAMN05519103_09076 [Rhizobiales bacterium GAS113]|nr:hypothetical protein SAMN05519103_09076 [Rhizobiales bacterium GAS113]
MVAQFALPASGQEAVAVAPFTIIEDLLNVLLAGKSCLNIVVDQGAFNRYLTDHGIDAAQLSKTGPDGAKVVEERHKFRRASARHNDEMCNLSFLMFGPEGSAIPGMLRRP